MKIQYGGANILHGIIEIKEERYLLVGISRGGSRIFYLRQILFGYSALVGGGMSVRPNLYCLHLKSM